MGSVVPSGRLLGQAMAGAALAAMDGREGHVIELGAGTGQVTRGVAGGRDSADRLALVEREPELAAFSAPPFLGPRIIEGDATRLPHLLQEEGSARQRAIVSSLPLLSLPAEVVNGIVRGVFDALPRGGALVQFTYGPKPPVPRSARKPEARGNEGQADMAQHTAGGRLDVRRPEGA